MPQGPLPPAACSEAEGSSLEPQGLGDREKAILGSPDHTLGSFVMSERRIGRLHACSGWGSGRSQLRASLMPSAEGEGLDGSRAGPRRGAVAENESHSPGMGIWLRVRLWVWVPAPCVRVPGFKTQFCIQFQLPANTHLAAGAGSSTWVPTSNQLVKHFGPYQQPAGKSGWNSWFLALPWPSLCSSLVI